MYRAKSAKSGKSKKGGEASKEIKGGNLMQNVTSLAVPFAFLLAKQGLEAIKNSKSKAENAVATANANANSKTNSSTKTKTKPPKAILAGGNCSSCPSTTLAGGRNQQLTAKLNRLRKDIDNFLDKY
jgi:hypothetical protein